MNENRIPKPEQDVIWREVSDGVVLISPTEGQIRVLNEVGAQIWRLMDGKRDVAAIEADLLRRYNTSPEQVRVDLQSFLAELTDRGLLSWN
jgi:pyrroloquinoline quinone biosynthesis protein D